MYIGVCINLTPALNQKKGIIYVILLTLTSKITYSLIIKVSILYKEKYDITCDHLEERYVKSKTEMVTERSDFTCHQERKYS